MHKQFVGREKEISKFKRLLESDLPEFLVVYGRRRIGKTFLLYQYFSKEIVFDFSGSFEAELDIQLDNFFSQYMRYTKGQKETSPPRSWEQAFQYLADYLYILQRRTKKIVVIIDELPWLDTPRSRFVKSLEHFWNQHGSKMNNLLLATSGSSASWMINKLIKAKGGLYNRVTSRLKLKPFTLAEVQKYCLRKKLPYTRYQLLQLYMVMGGIPFYLNQITSGNSVSQIINSSCFEDNGLLLHEYDQLYESLYKNAEDHISIVEALASKPQGLTRTDLVRFSGLPDGGTFTRTLMELIDSDFVGVYKPLGKKKRDSIYRLIDFYSLFYLKFIRDQKGSGKNVWNQIEQSSSFRAWSGYAFENICLQHIDQILVALGISGVRTESASWKKIGTNEHDGAQIDLLIDRADDVINLCEMKFSSSEFLINKKYATELRRKRSIFERESSSKKKTIFTTLVTTYPAIRNEYYNEMIHSEVTMDDLFEDEG